MNDNISRQKLYKAISDGDYTTGNIFKDMELQQFIKDQPSTECVPLSEVYRVIAGHSDYHGDNILAALTCIAAGKEVKPVRPLPADVPDTNVGEITKTQAIEALETLKTYCDQYLREDGVVADYTRSCDSCPLCDWCWYDREHLTPDDWQIPQERTEE
jgi:hypothetical protein